MRGDLIEVCKIRRVTDRMNAHSLLPREGGLKTRGQRFKVRGERFKRGNFFTQRVKYFICHK